MKRVESRWLAVMALLLVGSASIGDTVSEKLAPPPQLHTVSQSNFTNLLEQLNSSTPYSTNHIQLVGTIKRILVANPDPHLLSMTLASLVDSHFDSSVQTELSQVLLVVFKTHPHLTLDRKQSHLLFTALSQNDSPSRRNALLELVRWFVTVTEPQFFRQPDLLSPEIFSQLQMHDFMNVPELRYLLYYFARLHQLQLPPTVARELFPYQKSFKEIMAHGAKNVLVIHNIKDGQGDELVLNATLLQALLEYNPQLKIVLYTKRTYLYSHPRVEVRNIDKFQLGLQENFDMVYHQYVTSQDFKNNKKVEQKLNRYLKRRRFLKRSLPRISVNVNRMFQFHYDKVIMDGNLFPLPVIDSYPNVSVAPFRRSYTGNIYLPTFRLCAELGLPFRYGTQQPKESLLVGLPYAPAEVYWEKTVVPAMKKASFLERPVLIFNGFGGEGREKGFMRYEDTQFNALLKKQIAEGYFILLLPNHQEWGTPEIANEIVSLLDTEQQKYVLVAPSPKENPLLHKYLVVKADRVMTVEGGLMHLAYALGKPMTVLPPRNPDILTQWFPAGADSFQTVTNPGEILPWVFSGNDEKRKSLSMESAL